MPQAGFIDHIGIGIPDLVAAKQYYDELMAVLGLREWFPTGPEGPLNYGPDGELGSQVFFYQAQEAGTYSRHQTGLHHLGFLVASRAVVRAAHEWAVAQEAVILDEPQEFRSTANTALRPTGLTPMDSSWRPSATLPKTVSTSTSRERRSTCGSVGGQVRPRLWRTRLRP